MPAAPTHRLRKHADYQHVYAHARRLNTKDFAYFAAARTADRRSETTGPRVGLTVPKAMLAKAHDRNRMKRRVREAVRANLAVLGDSAVDIILHPRKAVLTMEYAAVVAEVAEIFRRAAVLRSDTALSGQTPLTPTMKLSS